MPVTTNGWLWLRRVLREKMPEEAEKHWQFGFATWQRSVPRSCKYQITLGNTKMGALATYDCCLFRQRQNALGGQQFGSLVRDHRGLFFLRLYTKTTREIENIFNAHHLRFAVDLDVLSRNVDVRCFYEVSEIHNITYIHYGRFGIPRRKTTTIRKMNCRIKASNAWPSARWYLVLTSRLTGQPRKHQSACVKISCIPC